MRPWFFHNATAPLDDPSAPLPPPSTPAASSIPIEKETSWTPFTPEDNERLENAWKSIYITKDHVDSSDATVKKDKGKGKSKQNVVNVIVGAARLYAVQFVPPAQDSEDQHAESSFSENGPQKADSTTTSDTTEATSASAPTQLDYQKVLGPCKMKMVPVYWHAMHDTAHVIRATWFHTTSYPPVPLRDRNLRPRDHEHRYASHPITDLEMAARLEHGFLEMQPWSPSYIAELKAVRKTGREAEEKITVPISDGYSVVYWPLPVDTEHENRRFAANRTDEYTRYIPHYLELSNAIDSHDNKKEGYAVLIPETIIVRTFAGRRSGISRGIAWVLGAISRRPGGMEVRMPGKGIEGVVKRGFDYDDWIRGGGKHPQGPWSAADIDHLVLVIHGIGQKLTERVETFDFTYAINTFRVLMAKQHESMSLSHPPPAVLPINWRRKINFDYEDVTSKDSREPGPVHKAYSLADITPPTIPTVRNIISDVLLDIPYYLSQHRPRVLHAATVEANRIYRLWMRNNPGWKGKVSIIGHSLGSVIAVDILSRQPSIPPPLFSQVETGDERAEIQLEFPVRNLFVAGSPVGFFLLLNKVNLIPRITSTARLVSISQNIPPTLDEFGNAMPPISERPEDIGTNRDGVYGCIAAENIYNVIHTSDPIAYRLNPCVDPEYAETIEQALLALPANQEGFFQRLFTLDKKPVKVPFRKRIRKVRKTFTERARNFTGKIAVSVTRAVNPNFQAGEQIEENRTAARRHRNNNEESRGILESSSDDDSLDSDESDDDDDSTIAGEGDLEGDESGKSRDKSGSAKRPHYKSNYSFTRGPTAGSSTSGDAEQKRRRNARFERIIKTRMHALNENGQIDYIIHPTGALENQYISILTAHSGYWESKEFAYLVAAECGRSPGIEYTLADFKAKIKSS
ncbi:DDHD domain-containing protein [Myxozyma melibiosi]|uniref:DDHD domain-containing protein n=1 Tax=Myxozyma melibiosi TaxID=54550 RepID=A0ABR1FFM0_9ASCO